MIETFAVSATSGAARRGTLTTAHGEVATPCFMPVGTLADVKLLEPVVKSLGPSASLHLVAEADHSFHVLARSGRHDDDVMHEILDTFAGWIETIGSKPG